MRFANTDLVVWHPICRPGATFVPCYARVTVRTTYTVKRVSNLQTEAGTRPANHTQSMPRCTLVEPLSLFLAPATVIPPTRRRRLGGFINPKLYLVKGSSDDDSA